MKQLYNNVESKQHGSKESSYAAFYIKNNKILLNILMRNKILYNFIADKK